MSDNIHRKFAPSTIDQTDSILCPACGGYGFYSTGHDLHRQMCWMCHGQRYIHLKDAKIAISLDEEENAIVDILNDVSAAFGRLEILHPADYDDFCAAMNTAKNIVFSRPTKRGFDTHEVPVVKDDDKEQKEGH